MEMTVEDRIFLATRNFAEVRQEGKEEGKEEGIEEGIDIGVGATLQIIRDLYEDTPLEKIAALRQMSVEKVKEIQSALAGHRQ